MKKLYTVCLFLFIGYFAANAQENPLLNQSFHNKQYINPAVSGSLAQSPVSLMVRQQWVGFENAPTTFSVSAHTRKIKGRRRNLFDRVGHGIGGSVFTSKYGPTRLTGIQGSYTYHLPVGSFQLGMGLRLSASQYGIDHALLTTNLRDDPKILDDNESLFIPDADIGFYLYNQKGFYAGMSGLQLARSTTSLDEGYEINDYRMARQYVLHTGFYAVNGDVFKLEPSVAIFLREMQPLEKEIHVNLKAHLISSIRKYNNEVITLGASYRTNRAVVGLLHLQMDKFTFGYSFEYGMNKLINYTGGTHHIFLAIAIETYH